MRVEMKSWSRIFVCDNIDDPQLKVEATKYARKQRAKKVNAKTKRERERERAVRGRLGSLELGAADELVNMQIDNVANW